VSFFIKKAGAKAGTEKNLFATQVKKKHILSLSCKEIQKINKQDPYYV
jgi:hypothetical protein